jgi:xanthine dehydrogenase small subunit
VTDAVRFILDGETVRAEGVPATTTVLEYLREVLHRTGTKEGCAEGDCGACTIALGELGPDGTSVTYRAVNSCIRLLPTIDGREVVTVESLAGVDGPLHPVQQAMVDEHASQCGFCTPGFVMSLFTLYLADPAPTRDRVVETLSGNLCRCTGYRPIIAAGCRMHGYPPPGAWGREAPRDPARCDALKSIARTASLRLPGFHAPRSLAELADALLARPGAVLLAGGTDVGLWVTKLLRDLPEVIYLGEVAELRTIETGAHGLVIGAAVPLADAWDAIVAEHPSLAEIAQRFGSVPVRNSGTLCGNLANGSPIGDSMPALIALGAELELRRGAVRRRLPLEEFYLGYQRKALAPGEFVVAVTVPRAAPGAWVASYKIAKRYDQDISAVCAGIAVRVEAGRVLAARLAFGGMAAVPARARAAELALTGAPWNAASIERAAAALAEDFAPLSDLRASSGYRLRTAGALLERFFQEHSGAHAAGVRA